MVRYNPQNYAQSFQEALKGGASYDQALIRATSEVTMKFVGRQVPMGPLLYNIGGDPNKVVSLIHNAMTQNGIRMTRGELNLLGIVAAEASAYQQDPAFQRTVAIEMLKQDSKEAAWKSASENLWQEATDRVIEHGIADVISRDVGQEQEAWGYGPGEIGDYNALEQTQEEQVSYAEQDPARMAEATDKENDWSSTSSQQVSKGEKGALISYAAEKGVMIPELKQFDGDPTLLKAEIDALSDVRSKFPVGKKVILSISQSIPAEDFASTYNEHITLNAKVLRNRTITEHNIRSGGMFAVSKLEDIVVHEYGHIIANAKGNRGLEIAQKAYYNITKIDTSMDEIIDFLRENISPYSISYVENRKNRAYFNQKKYTEIIPEILVKHNNCPSDFTTEFIRLLEEVFA